MMKTSTYVERRRSLRRAVPEGAILIAGNADAPRNYVDNVYPFRQDSHFLYYIGVSEPVMAALLLPDGSEVLFGHLGDPDDLIWHGPHPSLRDHATAAGLGSHEDYSVLASRLAGLKRGGQEIHYLPPYRAQRCIALAHLLDEDPRKVEEGASSELVRAVARQRSVKTSEEIAEIEAALEVTALMYRAAAASAAPGKTEAHVAGALQEPALARGWQQAFNPIVTVHGEVLHNTSYANTLESGHLLLIDSGAEASSFYASDITRVYPVSGRFTSQQRDVYEVVLRAQLAAIDLASPSASNRDLHFAAVRVIAEGMKSLGLMQGDVDEAVAAGAHALFMPHGIGHMMGLDVHDMEDLGDVVGYPEGEARSSQFGLAYLRLARRLEPGFVITVEPGVYFIPALIDKWRAEGLQRDFICYDRISAFRTMGGLRIEDDVLITEDGHRVLGPPIAKVPDEVEDAVAAGR
jgi:Xaa-Pro aminopeptidase